jgi:hypothetical protein
MYRDTDSVNMKYMFIPAITAATGVAIKGLKKHLEDIRKNTQQVQ